MRVRLAVGRQARAGILLAAGVALWAVPAVAQGPVATGFDRARLARVDSVMQRWVDSGQLAGAVGLVLQDGRPVYARAVGWRDRETRDAMRMDAIFRIASQSKAITSVAVLMLMEAGRLTLSDSVSRFLPAFARTTVSVATDTGRAVVPARRAITIRDLLTHASGISYGMEPEVAEAYRAKSLGPTRGYGGWYFADLDEPVCASIERLATLPFVAQPGERFVYGYSTDVLGCVVERVSGLPLDVFVRTRITEPLGMKDTRFFVRSEDVQRLAAVYASDANGRVVRAPDGARGQGHYVTGPRKNFSGGAGLTSTAHDYARFMEMIRRGGALDGVRILSPRTAALMHTRLPGSPYDAEGSGFGLGFEVTERFGATGLGSVGSYGWSGAYGSRYRVDPAERLTIVIMQQTLPRAARLEQVFADLIYQALVNPRRP